MSEGSNDFAREVLENIPKQNLHFSYQNEPFQYDSYRHLHLLGMANMGLELDKIVAGKSYQEGEMTKRAGMIYSYCAEMFTVLMDYPAKLINETVDDGDLPNLAYVNSITYGKTALLIIEADCDFGTGRIVANKIMRGESLTGEETRTEEGFSVHYLYFDGDGKVQHESGRSSLIKRYVAEINNTTIAPLSCTVNKYADNSIGKLSIHVLLH